MSRLKELLLERLRCPESFLDIDEDGSVKSQALIDLCKQGIASEASQTHFSMGDMAEMIDHLRLERYVQSRQEKPGPVLSRLYYAIRPFLKGSSRQILQKLWTRNWRKHRFPHWPVDVTVEKLYAELILQLLVVAGVDRIPFIWFWPAGAHFCLMMTHDVETEKGRDSCEKLMDLDDGYGIKASFQLVPEQRYSIADSLVSAIRSRGFDVAIQDLNHDGLLFSTHQRFLNRVPRINEYGRKYNADGFRAAVLYRRQEWFDALEFSFDMSVPNAGQVCAQRGGCCTVFPYFIGKILEMPVTASEDYTLLHLLGERSINLWKAQARLVTENNGLLSFIVHPDYAMTKSALPVYEALLGYLQQLRSTSCMWMAIPSEVNQWWRARSRMRIVKDGNSWRIEGPGAARATLAYLERYGDAIRYNLPAAAASV